MLALPIRVPRLGAALMMCCLAGASAWAGHSRPAYVDGGQSADGRFVVTAELVEGPVAAGPGGIPANGDRRAWRFTWRDTRDGTTFSGELVGLRSGKDSHFTAVHAHIYVAPDGQTFAVWNPHAYSPASQGPAAGLTIADAAFRRDPAFANRLTIHRRDGGIVKALALHEFLREPEWSFVVHGQSMRVHWMQEYPGLTDLTAPRVEYAFHRISPDHTVLEFTIGTAAMVQGAVAARQPSTQLKPRVVRVSLMDGRIFADDEIPKDVDQTPVRPFIGDAIKAGGMRMMERYRASLDPLRIAGTFTPGPDQPRNSTPATR